VFCIKQTMSALLANNTPVPLYLDQKGNGLRKINQLRIKQLLVGSNYNNTGFSTAASPEFTFNADSTSGLYMKSNHVIGIGINNTEVATIDSNGIHNTATGTNASIFKATASSPSNNTINLTNSPALTSLTAGMVFIFDTTPLRISAHTFNNTTTVSVDGLAAASLTMPVGVAASNLQEIKYGFPYGGTLPQYVWIQYMGSSQFVVLNQAGPTIEDVMSEHPNYLLNNGSAANAYVAMTYYGVDPVAMLSLYTQSRMFKFNFLCPATNTLPATLQVTPGATGGTAAHIKIFNSVQELVGGEMQAGRTYELALRLDGSSVPYYELMNPSASQETVGITFAAHPSVGFSASFIFTRLDKLVICLLPNVSQAFDGTAGVFSAAAGSIPSYFCPSSNVNQVAQVFSNGTGALGLCNVNPNGSISISNGNTSSLGTFPGPGNNGWLPQYVSWFTA
jgi:hypothetical protein